MRCTFRSTPFLAPNFGLQTGLTHDQKHLGTAFADFTHELPGLLGALGKHLVQQFQAWQKDGLGVDLHNTPLRYQGGV